MDGLEWKTLLKWMIWGYPYFGKHPYHILITHFLANLTFFFRSRYPQARPVEPLFNRLRAEGGPRLWSHQRVRPEIGWKVMVLPLGQESI